MLRWLLLLAPLLAWWTSANAQQPDSASPIPPGTRVRLRDYSKSRPLTIGELHSISRDSILVQTADGGLVSYARQDLAAVEISDGVRSGAREGALVGLGVGAAVTVFFLSQFCGGDNSCGGDEVARAVAVFTIPAVAAGVLIGSTGRVERWRRVPGIAGPPRTGWQIGLAVRAPW